MANETHKLVNNTRKRKIAAMTDAPAPCGQAVIEAEYIIIRVPVSFLQVIVDGAVALDMGGGVLSKRWLVTDPKLFAEGVASEINREDEQGTTPFHTMFDKCMGEAIDQGCEGIEEHSDQEF